MRTRSRTSGSLVHTATKFRYRSCTPIGGPWSSYSEDIVSNTGAITDEQVSDVEIPGFKALQACNPKKVLPFNPFIISTIGYLAQPGAVFYTQRLSTCSNPQPTGEFSGQLFIGVDRPEPPPVSDNVIRGAVTAACAEALQASYDALSDLGELRETIELFITTAKRFGTLKQQIIKHAKEITELRAKTLASFVQREKDLARLAAIAEAELSKAPKRLAWAARQKLRDAQRKVAKAQYDRRKWQSLKENTIDAFTSAWFEYRFGWMPIIYSLQDIQKALHISERGLVRKRSNITVTLDDTHVTSGSIKGGNVTFDQTVSITGTATVRGFALAEFKAGTGVWGFDPLVTAYELVTLSWLVDYFFNIGAWIQTLSPFSGGSIKISGYSVKWDYEVRVTRNYHVTPQVGTLIQSGSISPTNEAWTVRKYERYAYPPPVLPAFNLQLNWKRYTDIVALLVNLFNHR